MRKIFCILLTLVLCLVMASFAAAVPPVIASTALSFMDSVELGPSVEAGGIVVAIGSFIGHRSTLELEVGEATFGHDISAIASLTATGGEGSQPCCKPIA